MTTGNGGLCTCGSRSSAYPEVAGACVEVEHEFLSWCAYIHLTQVEGVILLIVGGSVAWHLVMGFWHMRNRATLN